MRKLFLLILLSVASAVAQINFITNPYTGERDATMTGSGGGTVTSVSGVGTVSGMTLTGTVTGSGNLQLGGTLSVGPTELQSTAVVAGSYTITSLTVDADGRITAASNGTVGPAGLESTTVTPGSYTTADITVDADGRITAASTGSGGAPSDASYITKTSNGPLSAEFALGSLATGLLEVTTTTGDLASIASSGTGNVARVASPTFTGTVTAEAGTFSGLVTANASLTIGNGATSSGVLKILEDADTGSMFASFQVPTLGSSTVYTLPPDDGNAGDVMRTDGAGVLTWVPQSGGAPTGSTYITQTADGTLSAEQALSSLSTGIMRVATTTGVITSLTDSAGIFSNISDETGSGVLVGATAPTLVAPVLGAAEATSINKVAITAPATASTLTIADGKTLTVSNTLTFTGTDASSVAFGTGGTVAYTANNLSVFAATTSAQLAGVLSDETGTGVSVFGTSPSFTTQITSPKVVWTGAVQDLSGSGSPESVITAAIGSVYRRTDGGAATSLYVKESGAGNTGWVAYGSPAGSGAPATSTYITQTADGTLSAEQALSSLSTGIMRVATTTGVVTSLTDSAGILANISDETGSGVLVGATSPTLVTPVLGVATATSLNKVNITAPATSSTLTVADGKTLTVSNTLTFTGTDASSVALGAGGTVIYASNNLGALASTSSAQLAGVISNETGSGVLVFGTSPTITTPTIATPTISSPTITGDRTYTGVHIIDGAAMGALAVDVTKPLNTKSVSTDSTLTFSATPATGTFFSLKLAETGGTARTITIPSSISLSMGAITTFVLGANATVWLTWYYDGTNYFLFGDPVRIIDLSSVAIAAADSIEFYDVTDGLSKRDTITSLSALILASPAMTGNPTAPTASANDNDTSVATTAYVQTELADFAPKDATYVTTSANGTLSAEVVVSKVASGYLALPVQSVKLPSSSPAKGIDAGETNWRLLYDDTTALSTAVWQFVVPQDYGTAPVLRILYSMTSATTGAVGLQADVMATTSADAVDVNTESYDTTNSLSDTVPTTAGRLKSATITLTNADSIAAGDLAKIRLGRDGDGSVVTDSAAGDLEVLAVMFEYTKQ